jgi:hypothetical protein
MFAKKEFINVEASNIEVFLQDYIVPALSHVTLQNSMQQCISETSTP